MSLALPAVKELSFEEGAAHIRGGGAFTDLRDIDSYLDVHIPGSIALPWEEGPGMPQRARDCIPLRVRLVLLETERADLPRAAAALKGKGFAVVGSVRDGINSWVAANGAPASTERAEGGEPPAGILLDVADPGAPQVEGALRIPVETLWGRMQEVPRDQVVIAAGRGVRGGMAIGMLERAGIRDITFWRGRP